MKTRLAKNRKGNDVKIIVLTSEEYQQADRDSVGYCLGCTAEQDCCEPDARKYECDACGERRVYGAAEALLMGRIEIDETADNEAAPE